MRHRFFSMPHSRQQSDINNRSSSSPACMFSTSMMICKYVPRQPAASLLIFGCDWLLGCSLYPSCRIFWVFLHLFFLILLPPHPPSVLPLLNHRAQNRSQWMAQGGTAGWPRPVWIRRPRCPAGPEPSRTRRPWRGCCAGNRRWSRTARRRQPGGNQ